MAANISTTMSNWSATAGSNQPDSTDLASTLREDLQAIQAAVATVFPGMAGRAWRVQSKSADYPLAVTDNMTQITVTAAATISGVAATLGNGFACIIRNTHTEAITGPGSNLIFPNQVWFFTCDGTTIYGFRFNQNGIELVTSSSFSTASSITLTWPDNIYTRFQLQLALTASADAEIYWQSGDGSIDTGNNYYAMSHNFSVGESSITSLSGSGGGAGYLNLEGVNAGVGNCLTFEIIPNGNQLLVNGANVFLNKSNVVSNEWIHGMYIGAGTLTDRIKIYPNTGTLTGNAYLYGYR